MQGSRKIPITDLNEYITCKICNGYFVDASTIIECLHTFCRSCIITYLQRNKYCPVCDVQVHKSKPLLNIRPDKTVQDIVYKLVPRLFQNEMRRRREFYENHPEAKPSSLEQCGEVAYQYLLAPEESICLTLSYHGTNNKPRYLRCPAAVTMGHLKKLIRAKYDLSENHRIDILYNQDCLSSSYTLIDIAYIYLWKRKGPMQLTYRIYENTAKKIKLDQIDNNEKLEINNTNNNNWKEVQLRISENGEMSITGIENSLSPGLLEIVNNEAKYKKETSPEESKLIEKQGSNKELPALKLIEKVKTVTTTVSLPVDTINNSTSVGNLINSINTTLSTLNLPLVSEHIAISQTASSNSCVLLSSANTTTVFSTINSSKCSTKLEEPIVNYKSLDELEKEVEKGVKRKMDTNSDSEPPTKQAKPIILNHNISLLNLSNNHPLKKHARLNRNGENFNDVSNTKQQLDSETKSIESTGSLKKIGNSEGLKSKSNISKSVTKVSVTTTASKPLAMRAKTLINDSGVKPPCYQPRALYNSPLNVPKPPSTLNSLNNVAGLSVLSTSLTQTTNKLIITSASNTATSTQSLNFTTKPINSQVSTNHTTSKSTNAPNKTTSKSPISTTQNVNVTNKTNTPTQPLFNFTVSKAATSISQANTISVQTTSSKVTTTSQQSTQPVQSNINKLSTSVTSQNNKILSPTKAKASTAIGYKTLRDPPKSWNSQISKANLNKSSPDPKYSDLKNVRPAKFFKMRNNIPRYLGNPASGVKPMYQVHVSPEKEKSSENVKSEKSEIKKHSIVKIDPKTLKPVSEKAPDTTSLSNHNTILPTTNLITQIGQLYPNPSQCLNTAVTTVYSGNIQNDLKINTSSVSITNPLKLQSSSPKNERKSPKSPHSPKIKNSSPPIGNKRDNKIARNFTPPNPFVPNIPTKPSISPNQFIYPAMPPGFPTYDPRVMAAYYNQWYSQHMSFPSSALSGLNLDLNQRKNLEILNSAGSANMDALAQSMLSHQLSSRPTPPTSTSIPALQRSHAVPLSPTINKPIVSSKKQAKEIKNDKSLETVVEKMTQNRNKSTGKSQLDISKDENKSELLNNKPKVEQLNDSDNLKKKEEDKTEHNKKSDITDSGTKSLNIAPSKEVDLQKNNDASKNIEQIPSESSEKYKVTEELKVETKQTTENSVQPDESMKTVPSPKPTDKETEEKKEFVEKENSNTENTLPCNEKENKKVELINNKTNDKKEDIDSAENQTEEKKKE